MAHYKWTNAKVLLNHGVNQLQHGVKKWDQTSKIPITLAHKFNNIRSCNKLITRIELETSAISKLFNDRVVWQFPSFAHSDKQQKYLHATEARNNFIAASQNLKSCQKYLSNIQFPYVKPQEVITLDRAIEHIYTDMQTPDRAAHAMQCYSVTQKRAAALLQWFDNVSTADV